MTFAGLPHPALEDDDGEIEVEPENWPIVQLFMALDTQWRVTPITGKRGTGLLRTGLDLSPLPPIAACLGIGVDQALLAGIKVLEREAMEHFNRRTKRALNGS